MPFDFRNYDAKCADLDGDALQLEWEHYTRLISGAATSTAVSGLAFVPTAGMSSVSVGLSAPAIYNARKKREIIERHLQRVGRTHITRKRDVIGGSAISGTIGAATLGFAPAGADALFQSATERGIALIAENPNTVDVATHMALDTAGAKIEDLHSYGKKERSVIETSSLSLEAGRTPPLPTPGPETSVVGEDRVRIPSSTCDDVSFQAVSTI